jgi:hypothetical protein
MVKHNHDQQLALCCSQSRTFPRVGDVTDLGRYGQKTSFAGSRGGARCGCRRRRFTIDSKRLTNRSLEAGMRGEDVRRVSKHRSRGFRFFCGPLTKRLRAQPMANQDQHRNETAPEVHRLRMITLNIAVAYYLPLVGAYATCSCVDPADLPSFLWLRGLVDPASMFHT